MQHWWQKASSRFKRFDPKEALEAAGATVDIVSPEDQSVVGWDHTQWGKSVTVDDTLDQARAAHYDARKMIEEFEEGVHGGAGVRQRARAQV